MIPDEAISRLRFREIATSPIHSDEWSSRDDNLYESSLQTTSRRD